MIGIRSRLAITLVGLVVLSVTAVGVGTYVFVEARLHAGLLDEMSRQAQFDLSVLLPGRLDDGADRRAFEASGLPEAFRLRGDADVLVDFGDGDPYVSRATLLALGTLLPAEMRQSIDAGSLGYVWKRFDGRSNLVVGGRQGNGPVVYLVADASPLEAVLLQLRLGLIAAGLIGILVALATAQFIARRILRPIAAGSMAAERIASGDLAARITVDGGDEFAAWAADFNRMAMSLERTVASLERAQDQNRRFVSDVSHELRTPLTALVAEASMIEAGRAQLGPEARRAADLLIGDVRRLRTLVDDLLEVSRFDALAETPSLAPVDLCTVVRAAVAARLPASRLDLPTTPVMVDTDVRRIDRVVGNLLDNARIHAPGARVDVSLIASDQEIRIAVADRGPGVSDEALPHLFDRFFKADRSRGEASLASSGLGLAIAAEHAALLGWALTAEPRDGGGLTFTVSLPVTGSLRAGDLADTSEVQASDRRNP